LAERFIAPGCNPGTPQGVIRPNRILAANGHTLPERAAVSKEFLTHSVLGVPDLRIASDISRYSPVETRVEINFPRASPLGIRGRPIFFFINLYCVTNSS
jgi:hypothetical protein